MIFAASMSLLVSYISGVTGMFCDWFDQFATQDRQCWQAIVDDVCAWAGLFGTASMIFFFMFLVELGSSITDCSAMCCCPPVDSHWAKKENANAADGAYGGKLPPGVVVGNPVGTTAVDTEVAQ